VYWISCEVNPAIRTRANGTIFFGTTKNSGGGSWSLMGSERDFKYEIVFSSNLKRKETETANNLATIARYCTAGNNAPRAHGSHGPGTNNYR